MPFGVFWNRTREKWPRLNYSRTCNGDCMGKTENEPPLVVCDAGPLIHLDELGALELLPIFPQFWCPRQCGLKLRSTVRPRFPTLVYLCSASHRKKKVPPELDALNAIFSLHIGEWEALRVALEYQSSLLLTDDTAARMAAGSLRIAAHGTVGILVRSIRRGQRTKAEVISILESIPTRSTLHLKRSLLDRVIAEVLASASLLMRRRGTLNEKRAWRPVLLFPHRPSHGPRASLLAHQANGEQGCSRSLFFPSPSPLAFRFDEIAGSSED